MKYRFLRITSARYFLWKMGLKYVKAFFWERNLVGEIPKTETKISVNVKLATIHDFARAHSHFGSLPLRKDDALKRLNNDNLCFIAIWNGMIVGYMWVSLKRKVYIPEFEREIVFRNDEAYFYHGFVHPNFRRKGLLNKMTEEALHYLKSHNTRRATAYTETVNKPPQRALLSLGFRPTKLVKFFRIFVFKKFEEHKLRTYAR